MSVLNLWSDAEAAAAVAHYGAQGVAEPLALRTYSARLLGADPDLVLHGGGNTSVKTSVTGLLGETIPVLCVKGSGWDLGTIEPPGHPAVRLEPLRALRALNSLSDEAMVAAQRNNLIDPAAPNPSVEALLHAFLPHTFVDHTHSSALLALADQPDAAAVCRQVFGERVVLVPYVMPGFALAQSCADLYEAAAERAVLDYGQSIRDLALSNIFAGDLLLKNFGVTRHGRVIFYDYDELCQVTDCRFREVPVADNDEDEMRGETWFYVADNDVFPETFLNFLAFTDEQRAAFLNTHGDLLTADFWRGIQQRVRGGELLEVLPYQPRRVRVGSSL